MNVYRCPDNPIIEPKDVKPWIDGHEVIGTFNAGVTRFADEIILLLRVAERATGTNPDIQYITVYDIERQQIVEIPSGYGCKNSCAGREKTETAIVLGDDGA